MISYFTHFQRQFSDVDSDEILLTIQVLYSISKLKWSLFKKYGPEFFKVKISKFLDKKRLIF